MSDSVSDLRRDYKPRLLAYLANPDEKGLNSAYELGRQSIDRDIGLLDLVRVHNELAVEVMSTARTVDEAQLLARAAADFVFEALSSFEMTQRGFMAGDGLARRSPNRGESATRTESR